MGTTSDRAFAATLVALAVAGCGAALTQADLCARRAAAWCTGVACGAPSSEGFDEVRAWCEDDLAQLADTFEELPADGGCARVPQTGPTSTGCTSTGRRHLRRRRRARPGRSRAIAASCTAGSRRTPAAPVPCRGSTVSSPVRPPVAIRARDG